MDMLHTVDLVEGPSGSVGRRLLPCVCASLSWGPRRGSRFAQVAAHAERRGREVTSRPVSTSDVSDLGGGGQIQASAARVTVGPRAPGKREGTGELATRGPRQARQPALGSAV